MHVCMYICVCSAGSSIQRSRSIWRAALAYRMAPAAWTREGMSSHSYMVDLTWPDLLYSSQLSCHSQPDRSRWRSHRLLSGLSERLEDKGDTSICTVCMYVCMCVWMYVFRCNEIYVCMFVCRGVTRLWNPVWSPRRSYSPPWERIRLGYLLSDSFSTKLIITFIA
jgi:hypothetical protein